MNRSATVVFTAMAALTLSACNDNDVATGPMRTETRNVGSFDSIDVEGNTRIEIVVGSPESLVLEGRDGYLKRIKTEVHGDTLQIKSRRKDWGWSNGGSRVVLKISVPHLASLDLQGGNEVRINGFNGGDTSIHIKGAADIQATGQLDELDVSMSGAGNADLSKLVANDAKVRVSGVGSIYVHPRDTLDATMNGVGAIFYAGSPRQVNTHMNGLGTISQRDGGQSVASEPKKVDPDSLQPEYEQPGSASQKPAPAKEKPDPSKVQSTGVI
jgi:hypothetical protein